MGYKNIEGYKCESQNNPERKTREKRRGGQTLYPVETEEIVKYLEECMKRISKCLFSLYNSSGYLWLRLFTKFRIVQTDKIDKTDLFVLILLVFC